MRARGSSTAWLVSGVSLRRDVASWRAPRRCSSRSARRGRGSRQASSTSACRASRRASTRRTRDGAVPAPRRCAFVYQGLVAIRRPRRHRARARDGVDRVPRRARLDVPAPPGRAAPRRHAARARRGRRDARRADLRRRAAGRRARLGPARSAARPGVVREVRRGEGRPSRSSSVQPYAPLLALLAHPGLAIAVPRPGGPAGRERTLPGRRARPPIGSRWKRRRRGAGDAAPERPPRSCTRSPTTRPRSPGSLPAARSTPRCSRRRPSWAAVGLQVVSGPTWRMGLLALRDRPGRSPAARRCARPWRSRSIPALLRPALGQWAVPHAAWLPPGAWAVRDAGPPRLRRPRERGASWPRWLPIDPTLTLLASDQVSGPEAAAIADAIRVSLGAAGLPGPGAARAAGRGRGRRAAGRPRS